MKTSITERSVKTLLSCGHRDFRDCDLTEADLYGADLREADLYGANLHGAYLKGAKK